MEASPPSILTSRLTSPSTGRLSPAGGGLATPLALATDAEPMRGLQRRALERARLAALDRISVARAMTSSRRPVVLADVADNVGGGSAGDGTALLSELIRQGCRSALVIIADPEVARAAVAAAPGTYTGPLGGKTDDRLGRPVNVLAKVVAASDGHCISNKHCAACLAAIINHGIARRACLPRFDQAILSVPHVT